jgi:dimethylaniline monooxygenase (N-oxide forming)
MVQQLVCKKLIICTGLNQTPKFPEIVEHFSGEVIHTEEVYRRMNELDWQNKFSNKKVLVLGGGESAFDIGHIVTQYADSVYYSTKNYIEWFPSGEELPRNIKRMKKNKNKCLGPNGFFGSNFPTDTQLNYSEYSLPEPMSEFWHNFGRKIVNTFGGSNYECGKCSHYHKQLCDINETPNNLFKKYVVKRTEFLLDIFEEKVTVVYYPYKIEGKTVYTKEETIENVDIIVCASGYRKQFPFLDKSVYSGEFIKKIIPKNTTNIAFIGFARPTMASIASIAEMQSWWTELYFQNKLNYTIRRPVFRKQDVLNLENDHIDTLVIGCFYMKDLAKDMNLEPNLVYLFITDFELFHKIYTGSCHPMIYRINGAKSYPEAREILMDTLPDFNDHSPTSKKYFVMFLFYHLLFIVFCTVVAYIITYIINVLLLINKVKVSEVFNFNHVFWLLSLIIIFVFYR